MELENHPQKAELMTVAFTISAGENEGEYLRELNPNWIRQKEEFSNKVNRAGRK